MIDRLKSNLTNTLKKMNEDVHEIALGDLYLASLCSALFLLLIPKGVAFFIVGLTFGFIWSRTNE